MNRIFVFASLLFAAPEAVAARYYNESQINGISSVFEYAISLPQSGTYLFWTDGLLPYGTDPADTVLHVRPVVQVGVPTVSNDDCNIAGLPSGLNSCASVTKTTHTPQTVIVYVHGYATSTPSIGYLHVSGPGITDPNVVGAFGGQVLNTLSSVAPIVFGAGDTFHVVPVMNGLTPYAELRAYFLTWPSGQCAGNQLQFNGKFSPAVMGALSFQTSVGSTSICRGKIVIGSTAWSDVDRTARLYLNDIGSDSDGDRLGNALEAELRTCAFAGGANCLSGRSPRDTDQDGLEDGWEVLGVPNSFLGLPKWGANPRHKDAFVEIDYEAGLDPLTVGTVDKLITAYGMGTASELANPDNIPGISLHLDIGRTSCAPDGSNCSTSYGNWGGAVGPTPNLEYAETSVPPYFDSTRRGVFFHGFLNRLDADGSTSIVGAGQASGWFFGVNGDVDRSVAHELGHCLGGNHHGEGTLELNCKPNYRSIMNYAYRASEPAAWFSHATQPVVISTALNEGGTTGLDVSRLDDDFALTVNGQQVDWNRDGDTSDGLVAAPDRVAKNNFCGTFEAHHESLAIANNPVLQPGIAELDGKLYAFFSTSQGKLGHMSYTGSLTPCISSGNPPGCCSTSNSSSGCGNWSNVSELQLPSPIFTSISATTVTGTSPSIVIAYGRGTLFNRTWHIRKFFANGTFGSETSFPNSLHATLVDPWITADSGSLKLFYASSTQVLRRASLSTNTLAMMDDVAILDANGLPYTIFLPPTTVRNPVNGVLHLVTSLEISSAIGAPRVTLLQQSGTNTFVGSTPALPPNLFTESRPAIGADASFSTGLEIWIGDARDGRLVQIRLPVGAAGWTFHSNNFGWLDSYFAGAVLGSFQGRLQAVVPCVECGTSAGSPNSFQHAPIANGVWPFPETDHNDFMIFAARMCEHLAAAANEPCRCSSLSPCSPLSQSGTVECHP